MTTRVNWGFAPVSFRSLLLSAVSLLLACSADTPLSSRFGGPAFSLLPTGMTETRLAAGLTSPTAMALMPDGRVLVDDQCGLLRVIKNGALLSTPALTLSVDCTGERGLLGIAVDPSFASNQRIYVYYTVASSPVHNRVSRFTMSGDLVTTGSEQVLLELNNLNADYHNGGAVHFAPDGTLFVAVGDNGTSSNAQSLGNLFGKVLRLNADGTIPTNNPFYNSTSGTNRTIWALGFRNPYTFAFQPGTGRIFINDVGEQTTEEINDGIAGANYGWPTCEGPCGRSGLTDPIYSYSHTNGCAITGGAFYNPSSTRFPSSYLGKYMFSDYCAGVINVLDPATRTASNFSSGLLAPVDLAVSSDGGLFYLQRGEGGGGEVWRIDGTSNQGPVITVQPATTLVSVGQPASFTVAATGTAPLSYQWQRNSVNISGATGTTYALSTTVLADSGAVFRCVVTNPYGSATSSGAILRVTSNKPPTATITSPAAGTRYKGGQTIIYSASASDPETGALPASAYTWQVDFHHDSHIHPFMAATSGATGGSFVIPTIGETSANVYYAILLTVTDPIGLKQTYERDILPLTSTISLQASPTGATVTLDGQTVTPPFSVLGVAGIQRTLGVISPQTVGGISYGFSNWSDGGAATHTISTQDTNATYRANYAASTQPGTVTFVQGNANTGMSVSSLTVPLPASTGAGNLIVVGVDWRTPNFTSITDAQGNSYTQVGSQQSTPGGVKSRFYYARNIKGGANSVTVTLAGSDQSLQAYVAEYRGADITNPLDVTSQRTGTAGSVTSGTATTTSANDQILGFCVSDGACTVASGWSARLTHSNNLLEDRTLATAGTIEAIATSNNGWSMVMAAIRPQQVTPVASVTVSPATASVQQGKTVQLTATPKDAAGNPLTGRTIAWTSDNSAIATVNGSGLVTGVAVGGPVTIRATSEGKTGTAAITVTAAPTPVTASVTAADKVFDGTTTATITSCTLSGSPAGVTCSAASANFSDPNVGTNKTVTATGITLGGTNAANYVLTSTTATTTASILASSPSGTVSYVQGNAVKGVSVSAVTVPLSASSGVGNLVVVGVNWRSATFGAISDIQGNSFTQVGTQQTTPGGVRTRFYYARNIKGGAESVTVTFSAVDPSIQLYVAEYRGADGTNPLDGTSQRTGTAGSVTSGTVTTTSANDQIIGFCVSDGTCTVASGWSARLTLSNNLLEDRTLGTPGPIEAIASSNDGWSMTMAAIRPQQSTTTKTAVTASVTAANKVYDGTTTATITSCTLSGSPSGVTCSVASANFSDPNVGTNKTVTATGITLGGVNAGNYALTSTTATTTASILAAGSISYIQGNAATTNDGTSRDVALAAVTNAGDLLVVGVDWAGSASLGAVSDNQGNSYTQIGTQLVTPGGMKTRLYYARNIKGGAATVTVTLSATSTSLQVYVAQYRGANLTNPLDVTAQSAGSSASVTSGNATTTASNDLVLGYCVSDGSCTAGSGFAARLTHRNNLVEDRSQATPASVAATATSNSGWVMILAAFRPQ